MDTVLTLFLGVAVNVLLGVLCAIGARMSRDVRELFTLANVHGNRLTRIETTLQGLDRRKVE